jgi:large subunit ribosomal protein L6
VSRVGKRPVAIPDGVTVALNGDVLSAKGAKGEMTVDVPSPITVAVESNEVLVARPDDTKNCKSLHGLCRSLIANMVLGVSKGWSKDLEIQGVGFRADLQGSKLVLLLGYSSPIEFQKPDTVDLGINGSVITVSGTDKQQVGSVAARIRSFYPPEPYKGKGIRYRGEHVRRKAGKTVA